MKKTVLILSCILLCFAIAACGKSSSDKSASPSSAGKETLYFDELGIATPEAFEVVYSESEIFSYSHNFVYVRTFVGVKNVSDAPISTDLLNSYTLSKADGTVIKENAFFDWVSSPIVEPGQVFYLYDYTSTDKVQPDDQLVCTPEDEMEGMMAGENDLRFYQVSDLQLSLQEDGNRMDLTGILHCQEVSEGQDIIMSCIGFDQNGKPVCCFMEIVEDPEPGSDVEFTMTAEVYGSLVPEDLSDNLEVCAYSRN